MATRAPFRALALLLVAASFLHADTVHLKNGKSLDGEVIKEDADGVVLRLPYGEIKLRAAEVEAVERQSPTEYRLGLGKRMLAVERFEPAVRAFEDALLNDKKNQEVRRMLANAYWLQAKKYRDLNRLVESKAALDSLVKLDPNAELVKHTAVLTLRELKEQEQNVDEKMGAARALVDKEELNAALQAYERILAQSPDNRSVIAPEMAQIHVKRASVYARNGQLLNAAGELEAAMRLDPKLSDSLEKAYCSCALPNILSNLAIGELSEAKADLKRALEVAPNSKYVLYVAGRLEESLNKNAEASDYYARALGTRVANPTPTYLAELRKRVEAQVDLKGNTLSIDTSSAQMQGFAVSASGEAKSFDTENFTVYHYNEGLAREAGARIEIDRQRILSETGLTPWTGRAKIYLHRTQAEYTARTGLPEWTGGVTKTARTGAHLSQMDIHSWQTSPRLLTSTLPHEITHLIIAENSADRALFPRCFNEGFAVMMEPKPHRDYYMNFLRMRLKSQSFIPLSELIVAKDYPQDPEFFYAEGYALIEYLVQQKGLKETVSLVRLCNSPSSAISQLLKISAARSLDELEASWKAWIIAGAAK